MALVPENFLMSIKKIEHEHWSFFFYQEFAEIFTNGSEQLNADVLSELNSYMTNLNQNFRTQMVFRSTPFLVGFYFDRKEIRFYTPKLSQELFVLQQSEILDLESRAVRDLRTHAELAASLQVKNFPTVIESLIKSDNLPDLLNDPKYVQVEQRSAEIVKKLLNFLNEYRPTLFEDVSDFGLGLTAQYALLRIHLLPNPFLPRQLKELHMSCEDTDARFLRRQDKISPLQLQQIHDQKSCVKLGPTLDVGETQEFLR